MRSKLRRNLRLHNIKCRQRGLLSQPTYSQGEIVDDSIALRDGLVFTVGFNNLLKEADEEDHLVVNRNSLEDAAQDRECQLIDLEEHLASWSIAK